MDKTCFVLVGEMKVLAVITLCVCVYVFPRHAPTLFYRPLSPTNTHIVLFPEHARGTHVLTIVPNGLRNDPRKLILLGTIQQQGSIVRPN